MQFGRKSEKLDRQIEQLELRLDELQATQAENTAASHTPAGVAPVASVAVKPVRRPLPEHLPREVRTYLPKQEACPDCGGELKHLGEDVSEILEYVPARFKVIRQVRPKLACACCERIVQAAAPSRPIERGVAGPGLLAHVLVSKYCDHLAVVSPVGDLRTGRGGAGTLDAGGLGGRHEPVACAAGGSAAASRAERGRSCTPTTRRFRCWRREMAKQKPDGCGRMCETTVLRETQHQRRCGSPIRRIARASIRRRTSAISQARCRRMVTRDSMRCTKPGAFRKRHAGRMCAESFTICTWRISSPVAAEAMERIAALYAIEKEIRGHAADERREVRETTQRGRCWTR